MYLKIGKCHLKSENQSSREFKKKGVSFKLIVSCLSVTWLCGEMPKKDIAHLSSLVKFFYMCSSNAININTDYHKLDDDNSNNNGATTITGSTTTMMMTRGRNTEQEPRRKGRRRIRAKYVLFFFFLNYFPNNYYLQKLDYEPPPLPYCRTTAWKEPTRRYIPSFGPWYVF